MLFNGRKALVMGLELTDGCVDGDDDFEESCGSYLYEYARRC